MAWDDDKTVAGAETSGAEWNSMVTYIKSGIDSSDSINVSSGVVNSLTSDTVTLTGALNTVSTTEISYLSGVTSALQTQVDNKGDMDTSTYDSSSVSEQLVGETAIQTLTNKTLTSPKINEDVAVTATATEINYVDGVTSNVQTQLDAKVEDVVDDVTPQLGGDLDLNSNGVVSVLTAGTGLSDGDVCYLKNDGKMHKADASAESTVDTLLGVAIENINADAAGAFQFLGEYTTSGLTVGDKYFVDTSAGSLTNTAPSGSGEVVRSVGYALATTTLFVNPDNSYVENS